MVLVPVQEAGEVVAMILVPLPALALEDTDPIQEIALLVPALVLDRIDIDLITTALLLPPQLIPLMRIC